MFADHTLPQFTFETSYIPTCTASTQDEDFVMVSATAEAPTTSGDTTITTTAAPTNPFVDMLLVASNLTFTENNSLTFASTKSPQLDFFFEVLKGTSKERVQELLKLSWKASPLDTLKLIFQLRDIRDGKAERREYLDSLLWLRKNHPRTFLYNLQFSSVYGYWKDILTLLEEVLVLNNPKIVLQKPKDEANKSERRDRRKQKKKELKGLLKRNEAKPREQRVKESLERDALNQQEAQAARLKHNQLLRNLVRERLVEDPEYRSLHFVVAELFSTQLKKDLEKLNKKESVSLAAKWAPTPSLHHDRNTLIASSIAEMIYPNEQKEGESRAEYIERCRRKYQSEYLTPLRAHQQVAEQKMSSNNWNEIDYSRVPSVCMMKNKKHFEKHDSERFKEFLEKVKKGEAKISSGALMPHELVEQINMTDAEDTTALSVTEEQWKSYVNELKKNGMLDSAIAVCDVSGSMYGEPMNVAIALSLLTAELAAPPFNNVVITFSETPMIHEIEGESLQERVNDVSGMHWGMSTDFQAVFDLLLNLAVKSKLNPQDMVKRIFVFSDMEFNEACPNNDKTDHQVIQEKFQKHGYPLPEIVYWNLRGRFSDTSKPVTKDETGVAMISGFSGQLLKLFLGSKLDDLSPWKVMRAAIDDKYNELRVLD